MSHERTSAIILAAGVARRLAPLTDHTQKSLLPVGDRAILARMLDALHVVGVRHVAIVVGHCADQVRALAASAPSGMTIECLHNPTYQKGSSMSLYCARDVIQREPTLIMDADVVFPREFLRRLVGSTAAQAFLIDEGFADTGESQGVCEYEDALHLLVSRQRVEAVDVTGLPWTEVDFAEDLHRAQSEVFPAIAKLEGT